MEEKIDDSEVLVLDPKSEIDLSKLSLSTLARDTRPFSTTQQSTAKPIPSSKGQFIYNRELAPARELNVYDVKNVYRSQREIDRDIKRGQFKIEKTFSVDKNGNLFFLCYRNYNIGA